MQWQNSGGRNTLLHIWHSKVQGKLPESELSMRFGYKAFKAWLESKKPDEVVGYPGLGSQCPVACFYKQQMKAADVAVGDYAITWTNENGKFNERETPIWTMRFVKNVDRTYAHSITAGRALRLLKGCR